MAHPIDLDDEVLSRLIVELRSACVQIATLQDDERKRLWEINALLEDTKAELKGLCAEAVWRTHPRWNRSSPTTARKIQREAYELAHKLLSTPQPPVEP